MPYVEAFVRSRGYCALPIPAAPRGLATVACAPVGHVHWAGTETADEHPGYLVEGTIGSGQRVAAEVASALSVALVN